MEFQVRLKQSEEGFAVWVPSLPGCASQGETEQEALADISLAIADYLSVLDELQGSEASEVRTVTVQSRVA